MRPKIIITVQGGVADVCILPEGVDVEIWDYDYEGMAESELDKDDDGNACIRKVYEG
jgi:hypothetical protein